MDSDKAAYLKFLFTGTDTPRDVRVLDNITKKIVFRQQLSASEILAYQQAPDTSLFVEQYPNALGSHFYVDIDYKLNPTVENLTDLLAPSMVVNTGGGYHLYWLVDTFVPVEDLCAVGKYYGKILGADTKPNQPKAVLRVGGSLTKDNRLTTVSVYNNIVTLEQFNALLENTKDLPKYNESESKDDTTVVEKSLTVTKFNSLLTSEIKNLILKGPDQTHLDRVNNDLSSLDWYVVNTLKDAGLTKEEVKWIFTNESFGITKNNDRKANYEYYINRTLNRAYAA